MSNLSQTDMTLNAAQQQFFDRVVTGRFDKLLLTGEAGTGKTFVLTQVVSALADAGIRLVVAAPTHLARLALVSKLPPDSGVEAITVAALLAKFGYDPGDGSTRFTEASSKNLSKYEVIVLDEVSMLGQKDFEVLKASNTRMVLCGDFAQLPAVMARSAMEDMLGTLSDHVHLTEQMRQVGVIHTMAERNRHAVHYPERSEIGADGESITVHNSTDALIRTMISKMCDEILDISQAVQYRYITYTNKDVAQANHQIRSALVAKYINPLALAQPFTVGEPLMLYENLNIAYNGEIVHVKSVRPDADHAYNTQYPWSSYMLNISKPGVSTGREIRAIPPAELPAFRAYFEDLQTQLHSARISREYDKADELLTEIRYIKSRWTNINYPYAVTCHKSQGMSIPYVFLNTASFTRASNRRALLYVGISRAQVELHTVLVPRTARQHVIDVNATYRAARAEYEELTGESYAKVRRRTGLATGSPEEKQIFTEYLQALILDIKQDQ